MLLLQIQLLLYGAILHPRLKESRPFGDTKIHARRRAEMPPMPLLLARAVARGMVEAVIEI